MAVTRTTITKNAGWANTDAVIQLEEAFSILQWHGSTLSGIVTGITTYTGGGTVSNAGSNVYYQDVFQSSTSGIGTGASFSIRRNNFTIFDTRVNRPGYGYTSGEVIQLSAEDLGGSANGATNMSLTLDVHGGGSPIGYGSTTTFYDKNIPNGASAPFGVLRHTVQSNKKYGDTYRLFQFSGSTLYFSSGSGFHPLNTSNTANMRHGLGERYAGTPVLDHYTTTTGHLPDNSSTSYSPSSLGGNEFGRTFCSSPSYRLDLNIYQSNIDPKFAVLSYMHPTLSAIKARDNTFATFILHNFTSSLWDYNDVFLGGVTVIIPSEDETNPRLEFRTYCHGTQSGSSFATKRCAEFGFVQYDGNFSRSYKSTFYGSNTFPSVSSDERTTGFYIRDNASTSNRGIGISSSSNFNAVIKGIPINALLVPVPYYIPEEFVLIDFDYALPSATILQGDTVTISGGEVYTVITGSYNQTTRTRGILFCARTI